FGETHVYPEVARSAQVVALTDFTREGEVECRNGGRRVLEHVYVAIGVGERAGLGLGTHQVGEAVELPVGREDQTVLHAEGKTPGPLRQAGETPSTNQSV